MGGRDDHLGGQPAPHTARLKRAIGRIFPQLRDVTIEHAWSGVLGRAVHRMPQIGEFAPGMWIASAFGGHGLNTTAMAGCCWRTASSKGTTWRAFLPYDLVWAGGAFGRAAFQAVYWSRRWRDDLQASAARRGEVRRRRAAAAREAAETAEAGTRVRRRAVQNSNRHD